MGIFTTIFFLVGLLCAIWVIYDVFTNHKKMKKEMKILWTVLAVIFSVVTAIVYYFVEYKKK